MRHRSHLLVLLAALFASTEAIAELAVEQPQSPNWYATHLATLGTLGVATVSVLTDEPAVIAGRRLRVPNFDLKTQENFSTRTAHVSDYTLLASVAAPVTALALARERASFENSSIVYAQSTLASLLANSITKQLVLRTRPDVAKGNLRIEGDNDENYSFYSGHSALSFTSATSGSLLLLAVDPDEGLRFGALSTSFALAAFTAHARVRAGRHYPSDVLVGSLVGIGFGILVPTLHGLPVDLRPSDAVAVSSGIGVGVLAAGLLPTHEPSDGSSKTATVMPFVSARPGGTLLGLQGSF